MVIPGWVSLYVLLVVGGWVVVVVGWWLCLDPSDGVFGRFDLAALCGCHTLNVCFVMLLDLKDKVVVIVAAWSNAGS